MSLNVPTCMTWSLSKLHAILDPQLLSLLLAYQLAFTENYQSLFSLCMHLTSGINLLTSSATSWFTSSWFISSSRSSHLTSFIITTLIIHRLIILLFQPQNFSFSQMLPSIHICSPTLKTQLNAQLGGGLLTFKGSRLWIWNRLPNDLIDISSFEPFKKLRYFLICVTHHKVIKLFSSYLAIYIRPYSIALYHTLSHDVALYCTCITSVVCTLSIFLYCFHWIIWLHWRPVSEFYASLEAFRI